jgi:hypothetical protein
MKIKSILVVALFVAAMGLSAQAKVVSYGFTFNSYCDGGQVTYNTVAKVVSFIHDNYDCAGDDSYGGGIVATAPKGTLSSTVGVASTSMVSDNFPSLNGTGYRSLEWLIAPKSGLWAVYENDGGGEYLFNAGGLTLGTPPSRIPGGKSSVGLVK